MDNSHVPDGGERAIFGRRLNPTDRRNFLKWSGTAAATALLAACDRTPTEPDTELAPSQAGTAAAGSGGGVTINLGNDFGILNFAYALEQLEAAFYIQVIANLYSGATSEEEGILRDLKRHEVVHREFFQAALGGAAIPGLEVDFSSIPFDSRFSVLRAALIFEDTGVAAYNGAAQFLRNGDYLEVA
nr:ferritin-like domain-containing protein [Gemmatimonadales bacterium]